MRSIAGAVMVMVGAVGLAWRGVSRLGERAELLRALQGALAFLEEEMSFRFTPLLKLFDRLSSRRGEVGAFFRAVFAAMECKEPMPLREGWSKAAREELPLLREAERQTLEELGEILGQYDAQTQAKALHLAGERLAAAYLEAQEERQRLGKVYLALGVAGGAVTVLALI